jgi:electron transfer flavoprotein alpha subunit
VPVDVSLERCVGSRDCVDACAFAAVEVRDGKAIVFDNCTDCGACILACPTQALSSPDSVRVQSAGVLAVDFTATSAIAGQVEAIGRSMGSAPAWHIVDGSDAGKAADAIAARASSTGCTLIVLPHDGPGPSIAARIAAKLGASLLAAGAELSVDAAGTIRALRPRYRGIVQSQARAAGRPVVATLLPRTLQRITASALEIANVDRSAAAVAIAQSPAAARRVAALGERLSADAAQAALDCSQKFGAQPVKEAQIAGKRFAPDLYIAFGVDGSTEHNAAFRDSRVVVALVEDPSVPIVNIADLVLVGDVGEHARAIAASL